MGPLLLFVAAGYLAGSVPTGYWLLHGGTPGSPVSPLLRRARCSFAARLPAGEARLRRESPREFSSLEASR